MILTGLAGSPSAFPAGIPHIIGAVKVIGADGSIVEETPIHGVLTLQEGFAKDLEITNFLNVTACFIGEQLLPRFEKFFK